MANFLGTVDKFTKVKGLKVENLVQLRSEDGKSFAVVGYERSTNGTMSLMAVHFTDRIEDGRVPLYELYTDDLRRVQWAQTNKTVAARA